MRVRLFAVDASWDLILQTKQREELPDIHYSLANIDGTGTVKIYRAYIYVGRLRSMYASTRST